MENKQQIAFGIFFLFLLIIAFCEVIARQCKADRKRACAENVQTSYKFVSNDALLMKPEELRAFPGMESLTTQECEAYISAMQFFCNVTYRSFTHQKI